MESLIERSVFTNTRCYSCGALVYAVEKKVTANHIYHDRCFRCRICKRNLTGSSLNEEGDDIYCGNCYRKKQRGDCNTLQFQRAASERAEYVYNHRHPDQLPTLNNPRPPIRHDLSRHPSWTLHQLERQFLSYQHPNIHDQQKTNDNFRSIFSISHPLIIKTSFSAPNKPTKFLFNSSLTNNEPSPTLHFSPVFSPPAPARKNKNVTSHQYNEKTTNDEQFKPKSKSASDIPSRLNQRNIDLTNVISPLTERKNKIILDSNEKESNFRFPNGNITTIRRRVSNGKRGINSSKSSEPIKNKK